MPSPVFTRGARLGVAGTYVTGSWDSANPAPILGCGTGKRASITTSAAVNLSVKNGHRPMRCPPAGEQLSRGSHVLHQITTMNVLRLPGPHAGRRAISHRLRRRSSSQYEQMMAYNYAG